MTIHIEKLPEHGYLKKLPPSHQALVDQERPRIARVVTGLVIDHELGDDLGLIVVADLASELGKVFASALWEITDVVDEIRNAMLQHRRPVVVEGLWGQPAIECVRELIIGGMEYVEQRHPGALVLLVVDQADEPVATMVPPLVTDIASGAN